MWCNVLMAILLGIINNINSINFGICIVIMVILSVNPPTLGSKLYLKSPSDRARTITRYTTVLSVVINPAQNVLIKSVGHKYLERVHCYCFEINRTNARGRRYTITIGVA